MGLAFDGDLLFFHGFQQRTLRLGAGAVDFIGQQHLGEQRAWMKDKAFAAPVVDGHASQVAGHEVGGELHPRKLQAKAVRQGMCQRGFSHARQVFNEQVTACQ